MRPVLSAFNDFTIILYIRNNFILPYLITSNNRYIYKPFFLNCFLDFRNVVRTAKIILRGIFFNFRVRNITVVTVGNNIVNGTKTRETLCIHCVLKCDSDCSLIKFDHTLDHSRRLSFRRSYFRT